MRVKKLVLDGFKSYAHRQELSDLDTHFNAITGLNGSGKSNIFDAICFVMGISNVKKMRAEDQRELIFKSGNAGIQRASVTIVFCNDDPSTAPSGYPVSEYPEISISRQIQSSGKEKFFLNQRASDKGAVKKFFQSISLNVDNPHFMVLQGTVHKLISMKSAQLLSWLEEAAGTQFFDERRRAAERLIQGKERKVEEIRKNKQEAQKLLDGMRGEAEAYESFVKAKEGLEDKRKFRSAFKYYTATNTIKDTSNRIDAAQESMQAAHAAQATLPKQIEESKKKVQALELEVAHPDEETQALHNQETEAKKTVQGATTRLNTAKTQRTKAEKEQTKCANNKAKAQKSLEDFLEKTKNDRQQTEKLLSDFEEAEQRLDELKASLNLAKSGIQTGLNGKTVAEELQENGRTLTVVQGKIERITGQMEHAKSEIARLQGQLEQHKGKNGALQEQYEAAQKRLQAAKAEFEPFSKKENELREMQIQMRQMRHEYDLKQREVQGISANANFTLQYDQVPGYDFDSAIRGRVGELVEVKDSKVMTALSVGAGAKNLSQVVISTDEMASAIISKGRLRNRTQFIAMNKVGKARLISEDTVRVAHEIADSRNGWVRSPLEAIGCEPAYAPIIENVFGRFLICSSIELAKELAYHPKVKCKCVTPDGDVADPAGIISGGARAQTRPILEEMSAAANARAPLKKMLATMQQRDRELREFEAALRSGEPIRMKLEQANDAVMELESKMSGAGIDQLMSKLQNTTKNLSDMTEGLADLKDKEGTLNANIEELNRRKNIDAKGNQKLIEEDIKKAKATVDEVQRKIKQGQDTTQKNDEKRAELEQRLEDIDQNEKELQQEADKCAVDIEQANRSLAEATERHQALEEERIAADAKAQKLKEDLAEAQAEQLRLVEDQDRAVITLRDGERNVRLMKTALGEADNEKRLLEKHNVWIEGEASRFGDVNGPYYFEDADRTTKTIEELEAAERAQEVDFKKVNGKARGIYDQCKKEFDKISEQELTLLDDKQLILETIKTVEQRKWTALDEMVGNVSRGFSQLFAVCLPGATCRLVDERDEASGRLIGLDVKVAFSGKEKESLSELSGGQRSLLALCLVLAILRIRKAPVYVLDEVDAALDPSHTQNIGKMLQMHFAEAQFLLVSLKDGMFNNANVLYEIRNTQGYSEISRRAAPKANK